MYLVCFFFSCFFCFFYVIAYYYSEGLLCILCCLILYVFICECLCVYCPLSVPIFTKYYSRLFVSNNPYKFDLALSSPAKLSSFRYFSINK